MPNYFLVQLGHLRFPPKLLQKHWLFPTAGKNNLIGVFTCISLRDEAEYLSHAILKHFFGAFVVVLSPFFLSVLVFLSFHVLKSVFFHAHQHCAHLEIPFLVIKFITHGFFFLQYLIHEPSEICSDRGYEGFFPQVAQHHVSNNRLPPHWCIQCLTHHLSFLKVTYTHYKSKLVSKGAQ